MIHHHDFQNDSQRNFTHFHRGGSIILYFDSSVFQDAVQNRSNIALRLLHQICAGIVAFQQQLLDFEHGVARFEPPEKPDNLGELGRFHKKPLSIFHVKCLLFIGHLGPIRQIEQYILVIFSNDDTLYFIHFENQVFEILFDVLLKVRCLWGFTEYPFCQGDAVFVVQCVERVVPNIEGECFLVDSVVFKQHLFCRIIRKIFWFFLRGDCLEIVHVIVPVLVIWLDFERGANGTRCDHFDFGHDAAYTHGFGCFYCYG